MKTNITLPIRFFFLLFVFLWPIESVWAAPQTTQIGVLAKRGPEIALEKWSATAEYLSAAIPDYTFEIVPLGFAEIHTAAQDGSVAFVLSNPAFYVELEGLYGVSRIATLINQHLSRQQTTTFGGVIFTRKDRSDIKNLYDLRDRSFMAVDPQSFGGWIMAWREIKKQGINPIKDFAALTFGKTHDAVVYAVQDGRADAGTVRSDTLERMSQTGAVNLSDFRILNQQQPDDFPFLTSTQLYPEWPMAAVKTTPIKLSRLVASALMAMEEGHPAALAGRYAGWTIPLNYQPVHDCLFELRIGPYKDYGAFTLLDVLYQYWRQLILIGIVLLIILAVSFYIVSLNRDLRQKKAEVDELNTNLEAKVVKRTEKINNLLDQEMYLRGIMQTVADINELLITAPSLEFLLKESCSRFARHGHYEFCWIGLLEADEIKTVYSPDGAGNYLAGPPYPLLDGAHPFARSLTAHCLVQNKTLVNEDVQQKTDGTFWRAGKHITGYQGVIALPLRIGQTAKAMGALTVYTWRKEGFEQEEVAMLKELAGDIGFAIGSLRRKEAIHTLEVERTANYEETIFSMVNMIEHRDTYTAGHTSRVADYCELIAREMGLDEDSINTLKKAAILHDIGKIATPDSILLKPGKLSSLDYELIKIHARAGYEMLSKIHMYKDLAKIILHHHERHDGRGYPDGLQGDEIPLLSRIMTVADAFDAMTTNRIYKPRKEIQEALTELESLAGSQFHPNVVKVAINILARVKPLSSITQLPVTDLEKRRFSYFFNDRLTGLYNEDFLKVILRNNQELHEFKCLNTAHLNNLPHYNKQHGWERGDQLVEKLAGELRSAYPNTLLFRAYGNDFVLIAREHINIPPQDLQSFTSISDTCIRVEMYHLDLDREHTYTMTKLDRLQLSVNKSESPEGTPALHTKR